MRATTARPTRWPVIAKDPASFRVPPNLGAYEEVRKTFTWDQARRELSGLPGGRGLNIAYEAVDRHAAGDRSGREALRFIRSDGGIRSLTYAQLASQTNRFAAVLRQLGVGRGERVFSLLGRSPDLYVAVLGTFKNASVFCPLFPAFGPEPVQQRLRLGAGRVLVTSRALYRKKVAPIRGSLPELRFVLLADADGHPEPGTLDLTALLAQASPDQDIAVTQPEDMALLHFTSGTTGTPKVRSTFMRQWSPTMPLAVTPWTSILMTSTGAQPIRAGLRGPPTASSHPWSTGSLWWWMRKNSTLTGGTEFSPNSTSRSGTRLRRRCAC